MPHHDLLRLCEGQAPGEFSVAIPDLAWLDRRREPVLEPHLPIIDACHHLWEPPRFPYLPADLQVDVGSGQNIVATVYVQAQTRYLAEGPEDLRPLGETEYVVGVAEAAAARGGPRLCAAIVGYADMLLGDRAGEVIDRHLEIAGPRFQGLRHSASRDPGVKAAPTAAPLGLYGDPAFRRGIACIVERDLVFDAWLYQSQLQDAVDLARAFPDLRIVLDHCGGPLRIGPYADHPKEAFEAWAAAVKAVAACPNVSVKLGGLGFGSLAFDFHKRSEPPSSQDVAEAFRPYIETCIEAFGPHRAMFESDFPADRAGQSYAVLWNAFKRIVAGASSDEKRDLFSAAASRTYRLDL